MTRFMMTLEEAVDLVFEAFEKGDNGDLFVQKSPACTVGVLAEAIKKIMKADTLIEYTGARIGEKLHETLLTNEERSRSYESKKYF
jgi:UDP-glucose 4-epimerase